MRIGILSDSHGRYETVEKALKILEEKGVELILHCGDIDDAETVWLFPGKTHFVWGNCDADRASLRQAMYGTGATLHEPFADLELDGKKIAFVHGDNKRLLEGIEYSAHFDYVFYGHTHVAEEHLTGPTRVINPGALQRARTKTCVVLDLATGETESIVVES
jgi:putative phosphoesterase